MERRLLRLRALTTRLRRVPGMGRVLERVRHHYRMYGAPMLVTDFDGTLSLEVRLDEHMGSQLFWYGSYSLEVLKVLGRLLAPGMVVVDAGANVGEVSLFAAKRVGPTGAVISFEPVPHIAAQLRRHATLNQLPVIQVVEQGLSDREYSAEMYSAEEPFRDGTIHTGLSTLYADSQRSRPVGAIDLTTLDAFTRVRGLERLDLIEPDVEGAELPMLRGAEGVLRRFQPWLIVEVQEETSRSAGYRQDDILAFLERFGYRFARIGSRGGLAAISSRQLEEFQNVLAIPPGKSIADAR